MRIIINYDCMMNEQYFDTLRTHGYRLTPQRRLVLQVLEESGEHLDAEALFMRAKARDPKISLATVYRSLALLKDVELVQEHHLGEDHRHFETVQQASHYHFTCLKCGRVIEFAAAEIAEAARRLSEYEGLQVIELHVHFSGYCPACQQGSPLPDEQLEDG